MYEPVLFFNPEHLKEEAKSIHITKLDIWGIKNNILPLKTILNTEVIVFQDALGEIKIFKNYYGITGTLISNAILNLQGWFYNPQVDNYQKQGQVLVLQDAGKYNLIPAATSQPVLDISTVFIRQVGNTEPLMRISTFEDLEYFFNPEILTICDTYYSTH